jgi:hypothetical protein
MEHGWLADLSIYETDNTGPSDACQSSVYGGLHYLDYIIRAYSY